ncbi:GNAT family N-acetyltransferase [Paenibacillus sp. FSL H7-0714]|uniref:GNAT family N-acetyltransferase n=1 Tax=Paenibacillus sp. FSL H7-0714 TaxID=2954735 RepID=UPI0030F860DC
MRHSLNDRLLQMGGHIGFGVRPSMRLKGYATELLRQSLIKAREMNHPRMLILEQKSRDIGSELSSLRLTGNR